MHECWHVARRLSLSKTHLSVYTNRALSARRLNQVWGEDEVVMDVGKGAVEADAGTLASSAVAANEHATVPRPVFLDTDNNDEVRYDIFRLSRRA